MAATRDPFAIAAWLDHAHADVTQFYSAQLRPVIAPYPAGLRLVQDWRHVTAYLDAIAQVALCDRHQGYRLIRLDRPNVRDWLRSGPDWPDRPAR